MSAVHIIALGNILGYLALTQKDNIFKLRLPKIINYENFMEIDTTCRKNLEITTNINCEPKGTLLNAIDKTVTKSGSRLLYKFLQTPLLDIDKINKRLSFTEFFCNNFELTQNIRSLLNDSYDLEKIISKINSNRVNPRDLLAIKLTLETSLSIKSLFINTFGIKIPMLVTNLVEILSGDVTIIELIQESIRENVINNISEGGYIRVDYHDKIKELNDLINNGKVRIENLKESYRKITNIDSLKILHNNILGLHIEIHTKFASQMMDQRFFHRQNVGNYARYTTNELQDLESKMSNAKTSVINLEKELFKEICNIISQKSDLLILLADTLKTLDVFCNFALLAVEYNYTKPILTDNLSFQLQDALHPVLEQIDNFTHNNCLLTDDSKIILITGPNMSGKSTYLRQNALIAILAQIGSFVPAAYAKIGIVDKIFSRVGAGDDIAGGSSTFMMEMLEVSAILNQATARSLVILDEVGRGTSSSDGVSLAYAILEYIHNNIKCRCLFATHYFELTKLCSNLSSLKNYTIKIEETNGHINFTYKIIEGVSDKSYGIHVAKLAGIPFNVIERANQILLERQIV